MQTKNTKRSLSFILTLAMLIIAVTAILTVVGSASGTPAESGEIEDFGFQTLSGTAVGDEETDLRFLFSIGNLDYDEVGFVFSTSADPVKTDAPKANYKAMTKAYRSVTANGDDIPAPTGRFWVAVSLSDIPHSGFATNVYVRPYVEDGSGTRYGEVKHINVCEAIGHVHEIKNPTGTATLLTAGTRCGDCSLCGLTDIVELDVRAAVEDSIHPEQKFLNGESDASEFDRAANVKTTPTGSQKYYPDAENNYEGRDFYFEIDMLWNETMLNSIQNKFQLCFWRNSKNIVPLFYFTPKAYADRASGAGAGDKGDNPWSGGFDWTNGNDTLEGPAGGVGCLFDRYPNLNDSGDEQDWGWHRIGVRVHEDADSDGVTVTYSGVFYLYIDGVQRWKVDLNANTLNSKSVLLYTMDADGTYHANSNTFYFDFWATDLDLSTEEVHMITTRATSSAVIPSQFSTGVVPVSDPVDSKFVLKNDQVVSAKVWFMAEHEHVWDGEPVVTREATVLAAGKRADHCKLCGAENPSGEAVAFVPTVYTSTNGTFGEEDNVSGYGLNKSLTAIRGNEHFYPKNGHSAKNLYFEYSILWNETLQNWDDATEKSEMKVITFYKSGKHKEFFLLYSNAGMSGDCPYADHFDYSCYLTGCNPSWSCAEDPGNGLPIYKAGWDNPISTSSSPSIGEYGWHRLGVLVHQEASGSGSTVNYSGWSELYVDGVKVWKVKSDFVNKDSYLAKNGLSLFTATSSNSNLTYSDTTPDVRCRFDRFASSGDPAYAIFGEAYWRIVDLDFDPTAEIEPVASPAAVDYVIPGTDVHVNGAVYFKLAD